MSTPKKKTVVLPSKPRRSADADEWVASRQVEAPRTQRLTIDIPVELHRRLKTQCAMDGLSIAEVVRALLVQKYGKP